MEKSYPFYIKIPLILLGLAIFIWFLIVAKSILVPVLIAIFIAILLMPLCARLENVKIGRVPSAAIVVLLSIALLAGIITVFISQIASFASDLDLMEQRLDELITEGKSYVEGITGNEPLEGINTVQDALNTMAMNNGSSITSGAVTVLSKLIWLILVPIFIFLMLIYRSFLKEFLVKAIAGTDKSKISSVHMVVEHVKRVVQSYISGVFTIMLILSVCYYFILLAFKVDHAIFFAVFAGFLSIIPYVGLIIGAAFPAFYALITKDSLLYPIGIFAAFEIFVFIEGNLLKPYIIGHKVSMNPLTTILVIFIGEMIWGVAGMILIIPTVAILKEIFEQIDSLKPYAFLIGNVSTGKPEPDNFVQQQMNKLKKRLPPERK